MQPSKTTFFLIIGLAILMVIGMVLVRPMLSAPLNLPVEPQAITIQVVVAPSIKPWVDQAAQNFNQANPKTPVEILTADGLTPTAQFTGQATPPAAWLAGASFVLGVNSDLSFTDPRSVASTPLAWGAFNNRQQELTQKYGGLNWDALHRAAVEPNSDLKVVIASPQNSAEGLAALIAAAAGHLNKSTLSGADASSADAWLTETFKESSRTSLTLSKPAEALATRGASVGDVGILSQASWRSAGLANRPDFTITPLQPAVSLDYPFAIYGSATPEAQQAAAKFRDFLLAEAQQNTLADFFFDRAGANPNGVQVDPQAALSLLRWAERELR